jgi:hypothetical protein
MFLKKKKQTTAEEAKGHELKGSDIGIKSIAAEALKGLDEISDFEKKKRAVLSAMWASVASAEDESQKQKQETQQAVSRCGCF